MRAQLPGAASVTEGCDRVAPMKLWVYGPVVPRGHAGLLAEPK